MNESSKNLQALKGVLTELKTMPLFQELSILQLEELCADAKVIVANHRERIIQSGEIATHFGVVLSGAYKLSKTTPAGEDSIVYFSAPGDVIAAFVMAQKNPVYPVSVTAMGPSRYLSIPRNNYLTTWKNYSNLIMNIQNLLASRMNQLQNQKALSKANLQIRLASLLMTLVAEKNLEKELIIPIPLTRKEISDSLEVTVESVIRLMSDWSKRELITTTDHVITILQPDQIIQIMNQDS